MDQKRLAREKRRADAAREREEREAKFLKQQQDAIAKAAAKRKPPEGDAAAGSKKKGGGGLSLIMAARMKRHAKKLTSRQQFLADKRRQERAQKALEKRQQLHAEQAGTDPQATFQPNLYKPGGEAYETNTVEAGDRSRFDRLYTEAEKRKKRQKKREDELSTQHNFKPTLVTKRDTGQVDFAGRRPIHERLHKDGEKGREARIAAAQEAKKKADEALDPECTFAPQIQKKKKKKKTTSNNRQSLAQKKPRLPLYAPKSGPGPRPLRTGVRPEPLKARTSQKRHMEQARRAREDAEDQRLDRKEREMEKFTHLHHFSDNAIAKVDHRMDKEIMMALEADRGADFVHERDYRHVGVDNSLGGRHAAQREKAYHAQTEDHQRRRERERREHEQRQINRDRERQKKQEQRLQEKKLRLNESSKLGERTARQQDREKLRREKEDRLRMLEQEHIEREREIEKERRRRKLGQEKDLKSNRSLSPAPVRERQRVVRELDVSGAGSWAGPENVYQYEDDVDGERRKTRDADGWTSWTARDNGPSADPEIDSYYGGAYDFSELDGPVFDRSNSDVNTRSLFLPVTDYRERRQIEEQGPASAPTLGGNYPFEPSNNNTRGRQVVMGRSRRKDRDRMAQAKRTRQRRQQEIEKRQHERGSGKAKIGSTKPRRGAAAATTTTSRGTKSNTFDKSPAAAAAAAARAGGKSRRPLPSSMKMNTVVVDRTPVHLRSPKLLDGFNFGTQCMLREFARIRVLDGVSMPDLLPLRSIGSAEAQVEVLEAMWKRVMNRSADDVNWFARELLKEVQSRGDKADFDPNTIKLLNSLLVLSYGVDAQKNPRRLTDSMEGLQAMEKGLNSEDLNEMSRLSSKEQMQLLQQSLVSTTAPSPLDHLKAVLGEKKKARMKKGKKASDRSGAANNERASGTRKIKKMDDASSPKSTTAGGRRGVHRRVGKGGSQSASASARTDGENWSGKGGAAAGRRRSAGNEKYGQEGEQEAE